MAIRSVAELLPKAFDELDLDDVSTIAAAVGEQRESVFFEKKAIVRPDALAKTCSAFANTMGGLFIAGIPDESNDLVGVDDNISEPQLWVKDLLRGRMIPMPPFRARGLDLGDGRWLLLVLVEESSTTPHFTNKGAIYVRSPSSSDPLPVQEQRTLFDLIERGREAEARAKKHAIDLVAQQPGDMGLYQTFAIVPTGITGDPLRRLELADPELRRLAHVLDVGDPPPIAEQWRQEFVAIRAHVSEVLLASGSVLPARVSVATLYRHGGLAIHEGIRADERPDAADLDQIRAGLLGTLNRARDLLLDVGAHGDLRLGYRLIGGHRALMYAPSRGVPLEQDVTVYNWGKLDSDVAADENVLGELIAELLRALGVRPANRP